MNGTDNAAVCRWGGTACASAASMSEERRIFITRQMLLVISVWTPGPLWLVVITVHIVVSNSSGKLFLPSYNIGQVALYSTLCLVNLETSTYLHCQSP